MRTRILLAAAAATLLGLASPGSHAAQPPSGPAAAAVMQWFTSDLALECTDPDGVTVACSSHNDPAINVYYGNAEGGPGSPDALAIVIFNNDPTGNAISSAAAVFHQDADGQFRFVRDAKEVVGQGLVPGTHVEFAHGQANLDVRVLAPNDSLCCLTGHQHVAVPLR